MSSVVCDVFWIRRNTEMKEIKFYALASLVVLPFYSKEEVNIFH